MTSQSILLSFEKQVKEKKRKKEKTKKRKKKKSKGVKESKGKRKSDSFPLLSFFFPLAIIRIFTAERISG